MPTSATGKPAPPLRPRLRQRGFTLLELMVVVAIVAVATAAVALALRDTAHNLLDREAQSLVATLESARAESRASGVALRWRATPQGFEITGGSAPRRQAWSHPALQAQSAAPLVLGPEPVIGAQSLRLWSRESPGSSRWIRTDGLRAFEVQNAPPGP
ncbi:prepilin-type N-terminal cleavage/methylation domain-containing protein [Rhodoferax sp. OV413]|uniref:prepilin-type N-terminal cleavage/methylation domain-containing protein n=1 Tax=Rhodoferax sp. OV413 TaxID=1855285 RepID=UPI0025D88F64|nr:prepilin-type N-terminal cleavage/methylation domain-containing protein [Rhodoferax sp. OV413]